MLRRHTVLPLCLWCALALASPVDALALSGELTVEFPAGMGMEIAVDRSGFVDRVSPADRGLPTLRVALQSDGEYLLPEQRLPLTSDDSVWQALLGEGGWQRDGNAWQAQLPLTLMEPTDNCTHYAVLRVRIDARGRGTATARVHGQTCEYLKFTAQVRGTAIWVAGAVGADRHRVHFPLHAMETLKEAHDIDPEALAPPEGVSREHLSQAGLLIDGQHYQSGCPSMPGYPFCESLPLPSFSLAKSLLAGVALMRLESLYPGSRERRIGELLPACGDTWNDVTIEQALDMQTGHFHESDYFADEDALAGTPLFLAPSHAERLAYACGAYLRRAPPGEQWVYQSSATVIAVSAMTALLREKQGDPQADIHRDLFVGGLWRHLPLSPLAGFTQRASPQTPPLGGWGLVLTADDLLQLVSWLQSEASAPGQLAQDLLGDSLQPSGLDPGVDTGISGLRYRNGFWLLEVSDELGCDGPRWISFLSGHGGITVALLDRDLVYYYVSDNNEFQWLSAVRAIHRVRPLCDTN